MEQILAELIKGSTVLLETDKLPDFWKYTMSLKHRFAFRYEYTETTVKITIDKNATIFIQESKIIN